MAATSTKGKNKAWDFTDANGRRIGWMTPERFRAIVSGYYRGERYWVKHFADEFGYTAPSVYRWINGETPIKRDLAMLVTLMAKLKPGEKLPELQAPWLPEETRAAVARKAA